MQRIRKSTIATMMSAAILLAGGIAAERAFAAPQSATEESGNIERGQKLFLQNCARCHGDDGAGNTVLGKAIRTKDLRSNEAQNLSDSQIYNQIVVGSGNMPSLKDAIEQSKAAKLKAEVNDLVAYIRQIGKKQASSKKP